MAQLFESCFWEIVKYVAAVYKKRTEKQKKRDKAERSRRFRSQPDMFILSHDEKANIVITVQSAKKNMLQTAILW